MQAARADVLGLGVDVAGELREALDGIVRKVERDALSREKRLVLLQKSVLRLGQDALEVFLLQRLEFDANREASLQLRNEIGRFRRVERARRNEEDVIGLDRAVLRHDGRAFDDRQDVALHAFTRDVGA